MYKQTIKKTSNGTEDAISVGSVISRSFEVYK
jgi:hypothetical protein